MQRIRLRPYRPADADTILSWCREERAFYQWTAGVMGAYPLTREAFAFVEGLMPFVALAGSDIVGFFTLREPEKMPGTLRFGFVIVDPALRGRGIGREMLRLGLRFAFDIDGAEKASLGVFENNPAAAACYRAAGFRDVTREPAETDRILGELWRCREMEAYPDRKGDECRETPGESPKNLA